MVPICGKSKDTLVLDDTGHLSENQPPPAFLPGGLPGHSVLCQLLEAIGF